MSKLIKLIKKNASINKIKANLWDNRNVGGYVNIQDEDKMTALMWCVHRPDILQLLLDEGANVDLQDRDGYTALMHFAHNDDLEGVKILLKYNVDMTIKAKNGRTVLDIDLDIPIRDLIIKYSTNQKTKHLSFDEQSEILHCAQSIISYYTKELSVDFIYKTIDLSNFKPTWSTEQQSSFVKSLLLGIPTQFSIFTRNDHDQIIVLDGKNRIYAIQQFLNDKFLFCDDSFLLEFNGLSYSQLSAIIKCKLLEKTIRSIDYANKSVPLVAKTLGENNDAN